MKFKIGGKFIDLTGAPGTIYGGYVTGSVKIQKKLELRSVCEFTLWHDDRTIIYRKGQQFEIYTDEDELIVAGSIETAKRERAADGTFEHKIKGIDYRYLADKRIAVKAYQNEYAGNIVTDLLNTYLSEEGVTVGEIQTGPIIAEAVFNYINLGRALDKIADKAGFWWQIDAQKRLFFVAKSTYEAPWELTQEDINGEPVIENGNLKYRNRQYVLNGKDLTAPQTVIRVGDNVTRTFSVDYPIAKVPIVEISRSGGPFTAVSVGIRGVDTGKVVYWSKGDKFITHDENDLVLSGNDRIRITYQGSYDMVVIVSDTLAISDMQAVEGGSGIVEETVSRPEIGTLAAGVEAANEELLNNNEIGYKIEFPTLRPGLEPGQLLKVSLPEYGINNISMLIEEVTITDEGPLIWYDVTAVQGRSFTSYSKMFYYAVQDSQPIVIRENISEKEFLRAIKDFSKTWLEEERPNIFLEVYPSDTLAPSENLHPMFKYNNRVKYVAAIDVAGNEIGRKAVTQQAGADSDNISSRFFIGQEDFLGEIKELAWFGGHDATSEVGSGVEIDRQLFVHTKTNLETIQIERTDIKGW